MKNYLSLEYTQAKEVVMADKRNQLIALRAEAGKKAEVVVS